MSSVLSAQQWAVEQFSQIKLGDKRRTLRAVKVASSMAADPSGSIPQQNKHWKDTKGAYRLFDSSEVTFEAMVGQHWQLTRSQVERCRVVLVIQDTTELDFTSHPSCQGLGRFGCGERWDSGLGLLLHSGLAVEPLADGQLRVLGLVWNKLWARSSEKVSGKSWRRNRASESDRWIEAAESIGGVATGSRIVHVGDRESDMFRLYETCQRLENVSFLVRVAQTQRAAVAGHLKSPKPLQREQRPKTTLQQIAQSMPALGEMRIWVGPRGGQAGRWASCHISGGAVTIYSPWRDYAKATPLACWVVRVWESKPPDGVEAIEWILLSDEPVRTLEEATRLSLWYSMRWMIEQYHQCLKSGCKVESRQLEHVDRLRPLIAMCCVLAVRLLQLKNDTRLMPRAPAIQHVPKESVQTLAQLLKRDADTITLRDFTHEVAKLGGFVGRKGDGEPGWLTLWRGWHELDLISMGLRLAKNTECG